MAENLKSFQGFIDSFQTERDIILVRSAMSSTRRPFDQYVQKRFISLLLPIIVGCICGLEAILVRTIIPAVFGLIMTWAKMSGYFSLPIILSSLIIGSILTGLISRRLQEASGVGLDVAIESYHFRGGMISARFAPLKFLATLFTVGFGGSGGLVGPTAAIGHGTASYFSRWFKLPHDMSRILALCGVAGCVSGILHAPFGSAILALELCYLSGIVYVDLIPVLLSSISAYIMTAHVVPLLPFDYLLNQPQLFRTTIYDTPFPWSLDYLAYCIITALFTTLLGIAFIKTFLALETFNSKRINSKYSPVIGAALVGLITALFFRNRPADVLGYPEELLQHCVTGEYILSTAIILLIGRWITTFLTTGFGGSGGLFTPTILMGGLSGTIMAQALGLTYVKVLVTASMAAAIAGVINVPMAAVIIVVEIFGISFIIPAAIGSAIASLLARNWVIYPNIQRYQEAVKSSDNKQI